MCLADSIMFMLVVVVYHFCFSSVLICGPSFVLPFSAVHIGQLYSLTAWVGTLAAAQPLLELRRRASPYRRRVRVHLRVNTRGAGATVAG